MAAADKAEGKDTLEKSKRLARLVDGFLEVELDRDDLLGHPEKIRRLGNLLNTDLWGGALPPHLEPEWFFQSNTADAALDSPDLYTQEEIEASRISAGAETILYYHGLLKSGFWEGFKGELERVQETMAERERVSGDPEFPKRMAGLEQEYLDAVCREATGGWTINVAKGVRVGFSADNGRILFYNRDMDAIRALVDLIDGLPLDAFGKCLDDTCGRWFVRVTRHARDYCSRNCAARHNQKMKRRTEKEAYNEYHRVYRRSKSGKKKGR